MILVMDQHASTKIRSFFLLAGRKSKKVHWWSRLVADQHCEDVGSDKCSCLSACPLHPPAIHYPRISPSTHQQENTQRKPSKNSKQRDPRQYLIKGSPSTHQKENTSKKHSDLENITITRGTKSKNGFLFVQTAFEHKHMGLDYIREHSKRWRWRIELTFVNIDGVIIRRKILVGRVQSQFYHPPLLSNALGLLLLQWHYLRFFDISFFKSNFIQILYNQFLIELLFFEYFLC